MCLLQIMQDYDFDYEDEDEDDAPDEDDPVVSCDIYSHSFHYSEPKNACL